MGPLQPYRGYLLQNLVVKPYLHVATKEGGEVYVFLWGRYGLRGVIPYNVLLVKASLHVATNLGGEVCFGPWGSYGPRGVTPSNFSGKNIPR